jgi:hypothetical protein
MCPCLKIYLAICLNNFCWRGHATFSWGNDIKHATHTASGKRIFRDVMRCTLGHWNGYSCLFPLRSMVWNRPQFPQAVLSRQSQPVPAGPSHFKWGTTSHWFPENTRIGLHANVCPSWCRYLPFRHLVSAVDQTPAEFLTVSCYSVTSDMCLYMSVHVFF